MIKAGSVSGYAFGVNYSCYPQLQSGAMSVTPPFGNFTHLKKTKLCFHWKQASKVNGYSLAAAQTANALSKITFEEQNLGADVHDDCGYGYSEDEKELDPKEAQRRMRISKANKGNVPWNKGRKHSPETLARIKERTKQAMQNPKVRLNIVQRKHLRAQATLEKRGRPRVAVQRRQGQVEIPAGRQPPVVPDIQGQAQGQGPQVQGQRPQGPPGQGSPVGHIAQDVHDTVVAERDSLQTELGRVQGLLATSQATEISAQAEILRLHGLLATAQATAGSLQTELTRVQWELASETACGDSAQRALDLLQAQVDSGEFGMGGHEGAGEDLAGMSAQIAALTAERDLARRRAEDYRAERDIACQAGRAAGLGQVLAYAFAAHRDAGRRGQEAAYYMGLYHSAVPEGLRQPAYLERAATESTGQGSQGSVGLPLRPSRGAGPSQPPP